MRKMMIPVVVLAVVVFLMSIFVVSEGERSIVVRFGRVLKADNDVAKIYQPGLHFKLPLFDRVNTLDARIQTMDDRADRFVTAEKKDVIIDSYVKWRIKDFGQYYLSTGGGNKLTAESLLQRRVADGLRAEIGSKTIKEIVSEKRDEVMKSVLDRAASEGSRDLGIELIDLRIKRINLPSEISESIYARMRAEREAVARRHRAQGREQAEIIRAQAELEVATILSKAERQARITRGEADAEVAKLFANAFKKEPEFYSFVRSLQAYRKSFNSKSDMLVVDPKSDFFKYMKQPDVINK
ncbi:protease modulator HflC [Salinivibrio proteolyticus]|jgi:membrane protease subunit HflC|uniref:Protein HflC n=1 Tax=Salinivibrio proteolyticus TaxID=334715 RepID=A0ABY7LE34_9GAMM|nr:MULTISPECIES: protease modulator HflC [Salinivibrio]OOF13140.1 protease modulator HflC [Salinivibrio sp. PR919]OOF16406.1 protease modulator HflC [Salinivibrio sp. PR932]OOF19643.1 protease modulator HflC [Salinivibrio sp. IB574]OOF23846.1 protease modulator HflC [Salinivibrio sp. IB872]OOF26905.1 protease modulator HflC [Salinivibrio proteolyticus]